MQPLPLKERWNCVALCLIRGFSSHFKAHVLGVFYQRRVRRDAFVASFGCNPQWIHLTNPSGLPLQEAILCSKMYLFSYSFWELCITKIFFLNEQRRELFFLPQPNNPIPAPPHFLPLSAYFASDANDLPPLYSDARSVYTFLFHPHTNVLLLPLRPRAF